MKCPHCLVSFHDDVKEIIIGEDADGAWGLFVKTCPNCNRFILELAHKEWMENVNGLKIPSPIYLSRKLIRPKSIKRSQVPTEVPKVFSDDYVEACLVIDDSAKASAALSRRCLQHILREKAGVKKDNLAQEIQQVLDSSKLPTYLSESLDAVRNIGNFASHPIKSTSTGQLVEIEPGEAEWNLDVIESLFDFYFVQPEQIKRKKDQLNKKLIDAGKPPMK